MTLYFFHYGYGTNCICTRFNVFGDCVHQAHHQAVRQKTLINYPKPKTVGSQHSVSSAV